MPNPPPPFLTAENIAAMRAALEAQGVKPPYSLRVTAAHAAAIREADIELPPDVRLLVAEDAPEAGEIVERAGFAQRLDQYGKWRDKTNMDRFVILTFLTAEEKEAFCQKHFGDPAVDYMDGATVESITVAKP